jgi:hypothetical protein
MRLIPVGLGVVAVLQTIAAAVSYPFLTLAVSLAASVYGNMISTDTGARTVFFLFGLPTAFGVLVLAAIFMVVPIGVSVVGAIVVGRLGRRRGATASMAQMVKFCVAVVILNLLALFAGVTFWPVWFYSEKMATLISLPPLVISFALNAVLDAALAAVVLRSHLRTL